MAELMDHVKVLADQIGPRPVSTEEEHQTSLYVAQELTDDGLDVTVDEFATPTGTRWPYVIAYALAILGTIISGVGIFVPGIAASMYLVGLIFLAVAFFIYYSEYYNKPFLSNRRAGGISQNVVAKYVPSSVQREQRRRKVVVVAHVDTVRAQPEAMPAVIQRLPLLKRILFYVMIGVLVIEVVRLLPIPWPDGVDFALWIISLIACVYLLLAMICIIASRFMPYLSGANDNASSISVLLSVAKRLLDPEERERYAVERPVEQTGEIPVETLVSSTGQIPVVHDAETAQEAGVVPEGAEIAYEAEPSAAPTQVMNPVNLEESVPALSGEDAFSAVPSVQDQGQQQDLSAAPTTVIPVPGAEGQAPVQQQPAPAPFPEVPEAAPQPEGYQPLPSDLFAKTPEESVSGVAAPQQFSPQGQPASQPVPEPVEETPAVAVTLPENGEVPAGGYWPKAGDEAEAVTVGDVVAAPAPAPAPEPKPAPAPEPQDNIPSWYKTAKKRAAADMAGKEDKGKDVDASTYRSRFAEIPLTGRMGASQEEPSEPEPEKPVASAEKVAAAAATAQPEPAQVPEKQQEAPQAEPAAPAARVPSPKVDEVLAAPVPAAAEPAPAQAEDVERPALKLDFDEDEFDELTPDLSGMFEPVSTEPASAPEKATPAVSPLTVPEIDKKDVQEAPEQEEKAPGESEEEKGQTGVLRGLTSRIPIIGSSTGSHRGAGAEEAQGDAAQRPKPKVDRRKPTARHITQEFQPTRPVNERENKALDSMRQQAPASSTYEDTPQAGPETDPFAPREERMGATQAYSEPSGSFPSLSGQMPAVGADPLSSPGNSSSFPALTGSFPAISGAIPTIDSSDFGGDDFGYEPTADEVADDFISPAMTSEIDIPESRFHSMTDKVSGFFKHRKKRSHKTDDGMDPNEELGSNDVDNWDDDDDFGWKGGGYLDENESAFEAAKARAAEIRDSVIQMTENDLLDKEVWFVALGASSANAQGMKNFLELHGSELRGSLIINLEAVGAGEVCFVDSEGTGKPHRSDRRLQSLVKKASRELDGSEMRSQKLEWRNTDATPAMLSGMRAMSIMGFDGEVPANWHWTTDTIDGIDPNNLEYVTKLLLKMIENS
ncbi:MAG: M28 family peptidase [Coriobacteriales bacterium]|jgi:hypothetical protein